MYSTCPIDLIWYEFLKIQLNQINNILGIIIIQ